jgi:hypothetical protein
MRTSPACGGATCTSSITSGLFGSYATAAAHTQQPLNPPTPDQIKRCRNSKQHWHATTTDAKNLEQDKINQVTFAGDDLTLGGGSHCFLPWGFGVWVVDAMDGAVETREAQRRMWLRSSGI